jgi:hypothetical protein
MAEMVVHRGQILEILERHLVLSILNETQEQRHPSQITIKNTVEQIHKEMLASALIPQQRRILPMRAAI